VGIWITVVSRVVAAYLAWHLAGKACEATADLVLYTDAQPVARRATARLVGIRDACLALVTGKLVGAATPTGLMGREW